jgi:Asp-tRNA(Asn)/Glu-tRNA(Gln) amidotransferase A subunit family amidase
MDIDALLLSGACEQARAVAGGRVGVERLLQAQQDRIAAQQAELNAYVAVDIGAHPAAGISALAGSSFAVKDNIDVAGLPTAAGLRALSRPAVLDAPVVSRLKAAGLACLGKLNMHPMALGASNHNPDYGPCFNPCRAGHTPGGSSGGSGAAVAAGLCGLALGTDTMGSVRIPAAYCGVVGFKPSHDLLGLDGVVPLSRWLDHLGLLARRVEDIETALRIVAPRLDEPSHRAGSPWRLAVLRDARALGASDEVQQAFDAGLSRLADLPGVAWQEVTLQGFDLAGTRRAGLLLCEAELHPMLADLVRHRPEALPSDLLSMMKYIERKSALDLGAAAARIARTGAQLTTLCSGFDALLLPTAPQTAFAMDQPAPANQADLTALANTSGAPAISLPLPVAAGSLPVGLQLIGHRGHDLDLLQLSLQIEDVLSAH